MRRENFPDTGDYITKIAAENQLKSAADAGLRLVLSIRCVVDDLVNPGVLFSTPLPDHPHCAAHLTCDERWRRANKGNA